MSEMEGAVEVHEERSAMEATREGTSVTGEDPSAELRASLAAVRELALRAHPDAVPELVGGGSIAEVIASVEGARAAYQRIAARVAGEAAPAARPPVVPAGGAPRAVLDVDTLPAAEKIRRGLAGRE